MDEADFSGPITLEQALQRIEDMREEMNAFFQLQTSINASMMEQIKLLLSKRHEKGNALILPSRLSN